MGVCSARWLAVGACLVGLSACGKSSSSGSGDRRGGNGGSAGDTSTGGSSGTAGSDGGTGASAGEGGGGTEECVGETVAVPTRVVRLSFSQIERSLVDLVGAAAASQIAEELDLPPPAARAFPPLSGGSEGPVINDAVWAIGDAVGQAVGRHVFDNFEVLTDCGMTPTDECGESFVETFAERAARRPLSDVERENFLTVYAECKATGGTVQEAVQHGVYATIESPLFLYRFELGDPDTSDAEVALAPYEMASLLSFFLTDGPPDAELLAAAADGSITDPNVIDSQALRLLATPVARENLRTALLAYFGYSSLPGIVIDPQSVPDFDFTSGLQNALLHEGEIFFDDVLFGEGPVFDLLTSRSSTVNESLAAIYGISGFPNGASVDADGFARVELPETRAGLLTMPGFIAAFSAPGPFSAVRRGQVLSALLACETISAEDHPNFTLPDGTERERAELRGADPACNDCHTKFDPFGVALESFDVIGRERTEDAQGRPIDPSVTLHEDVGGGSVRNAAEMAAELARPDVFAACLAKNLVVLALADVAPGTPETRNACAVRDIERAFVESRDASFTSLVRQVAGSPLLRTRVVRP
jgi:hypothetical protein